MCFFTRHKTTYHPQKCCYYYIILLVLEFADESSFITYLCTTYNDTINANNSEHSSMQSLVSLAMRYVQNSNNQPQGAAQSSDESQPQKAAQDYIHKHLLTTNKLLKQKYKENDNLDHKIRELVLPKWNHENGLQKIRNSTIFIYIHWTFMEQHMFSKHYLIIFNNY